jgi:AraC-like DNA-binding protein
MKLELDEEPVGPIQIGSLLPAHLSRYRLPQADALVLQGQNITALLQEFKGPGFSAWYSRFWTERPTVVRARGDLAVLELRIAWDNQIPGTWEMVEQPSLPAHHFNVSFTPHVLTQARFRGGEHYASFDIHVDAAFLLHLGIEYHSLLTFLDKVQRHEPAELSPYPYRCPVEMVDAVQSILRNSYSPRAQTALLEYKVKEILLVGLDAIGRQELALPLVIQPRDLDALHQVKAILERQLPDWPSPKVICQETGLNSLKLKVGFKHLFGMTPYEYHLQLKMRLSKQLLQDVREPVSAIAYLAGYEHPSSFTREFHKWFGYTPAEFRKRGR